MSDRSFSNRTATPVSATERIASLDILRGVAILGILVMNIYAFAMPFPAYSNPLLMGGTEPLNIGTWFFTHILFDQKFLSIFAMLFGAGIILMTGRARPKARSTDAFFIVGSSGWSCSVRCMPTSSGLAIFCSCTRSVGMLAFLFRNLTPRTLVVVACLLLPRGWSYWAMLGFFQAKAAKRGCRSTSIGGGR